MIFSHLLLAWFSNNSRDLAWRKDRNPYFIWLSEIILQQTRVEQGLPYFLKFIEKYPTVKDLAIANEDEILKLWQGLGYYSRARNLHFAAQYIENELDGIFPKTYKELLLLKGVGEYTAAAIASIAYKEAVPAIDGNVLRVISRLFNIEEPVDSSKGKKIIKDLMFEIIDKNNPGDFNQAVMELGALVCKPKNPDCNQCPLQEHCLALANNNVLNLPIKSKKIKIKNRYLNYFLFIDENGFLLEQRTNKDIWKNLYQFPLIESEHLSNETKEKWGIEKENLSLKKEIIHKLTHQILHIRFFVSPIPKNYLNNIGAKYYSINEALEKSIPTPLNNFLKEIGVF